MSWLLSHAINPKLAAACQVAGSLGGKITFLYETPTGERFYRERTPEGKMLQPKGQPLCLYWPVGGRASKTVLLCEGEGDTLAAASVLCDQYRQPFDHLPEPLLGLCPVGLPGANTPPATVVDELRNVKQVYLALDADRAGQEATDRLGPALLAAGIETYRVQLPEGKDLADCLLSPWACDPYALSLGGKTTEYRTNWLAETLGRAEPVKASESKPLPRPKQLDTHDDLRDIEPAIWIEALTGEVPDRSGFIGCPLPGHEGERTPSFKVYPSADQGFNCFGCQAGGSIYDFAMAYWGVDFREAKRRLVERLGHMAPAAAEQVELQEAKDRLRKVSA